MNKRKSKVSIKDIAEELDISTTTVSFVINGKAKDRISEEVIEKVERYIKKVGYRPNSSAQSLRTGRSKTILYMAEDISDPFFSSVAKEMEELAFENDYKIIYCSTENKKERALDQLSFFKEKLIDAFIITPPENFEEEIKQLISENHRVVLFDRYYNNFEHNYVVLDNYKSSKKSLELLFEEGFKEIGFVGLDSDLSVIKDRHYGYLETMEKKGFKQYSHLIKFDDVKSEIGRLQMGKFIDENPEMDAILFATNSLAIVGLSIFKERGIKIPDEMGIVTFDDRELFEHHSPTISVLSQPVTDLAEELINRTLKLLDSGQKKPDLFQITLEGNLKPRESSRRTQIVGLSD